MCLAKGPVYLMILNLFKTVENLIRRPKNAASDMGLHCLHISYRKSVWLRFVLAHLIVISAVFTNVRYFLRTNAYKIEWSLC